MVAIQQALKPNAPLFLNKLETAYKQPHPFSQRHDGVAAWEAIALRGKTAAQLPGEAGNHDAKLTILDFKPLSNDATPDDFSVRVTDAITKTFPYLKRPFASKLDESKWVLDQLPEKYGAEARTKFEKLAPADQEDPHAVAEMCVDVMATARTTRSRWSL